MKIALFTSNQPRHRHLIECFSKIASEVLVVSEVTTIFPGATEDFYNKSDIMKDYFTRMQQAERNVFGDPGYGPSNVRVFPIKMGDVNNIPVAWFKQLESVDYIVVFGASWIRGELCDLLLRKKAINIHMGVSPYYRGATCNFWALQDRRPEMVGATIHYLSKGLDSGKMIMHALPKPRLVEGFELGMLAVKAAHECLTSLLKDGSIFELEPLVQDKSQELRYSRRAEFNDEVAHDFLNNPLSAEFISQRCADRDLGLFLRPFLA
ncbi:formyltransferase family protein [Bdellovibrio sp. HCB337]|uniref:formyltransferase family protein n=1 Tax=Bdellovibrio sp. HCB337 TaxID=3394358 RepID=UPI0039A55BCD